MGGAGPLSDPNPARSATPLRTQLRTDGRCGSCLRPERDAAEGHSAREGETTQAPLPQRDCCTPPRTTSHTHGERGQVGRVASLVTRPRCGPRLVLRLRRLRRWARLHPQGRRPSLRSRRRRGVKALRGSSWERHVHRWSQALLPQRRPHLRSCAGGAAVRRGDQATVPTLP